MADSEISTTLPLVTRRRMLTGTVIAVGAWGSGALAGNNIEGEVPSDPVVALWRQWQDAHRLAERLCRQQQGLERKLAETVGFPCVTIRLSGGERVTLHSLNAVHEVFRLAPEDPAARAKAEAEFAAHQTRWDMADKEVGYSATLQAEREAADRAEDLLEALAVTSATSLTGVAAKLDAVLHEGKVWEDGTEFPWPQIRSALEDLTRMSPLLHPGLSFPSGEREPKPNRCGNLRGWTGADGGAA